MFFLSIAKHISKLREMYHLSQEKFAEILGVSRQAVQKWEADLSRPDFDNIIAISKRFNISVDALLLDTSDRMMSELQYDVKIQPEYDGAPSWESYSQHCALEYRQSIDEGKELALYEGLFYEVDRMPAGEAKEKICDVLFNLSLNAPLRPDYPYYEPSAYSDIQLVNSATGRRHYPRPKKSDYRQKVAGAWYGRIAGCLLGKPFEGVPKSDVKRVLRATGNHPLHRYLLQSDITDALINELPFRLTDRFCADTIHIAPCDDDTNYTVLAGDVIDLHGRNFTPYDVSRVWITKASKISFATAEIRAYINFINGYIPPQSAIYKNPYREWIGATIRADYFGYINPGDPATAAEMAWRDASISHVKNGIYGEMMFAAMIAAAAVTDDVEEIVLAGLAEIPVRSRMYHAISNILQQWRNGVDANELLRSFHKRWSEYDLYCCHSIPNAEIVVISLLCGQGNWESSVCMTVEQGFDTDCNGATVGSIVGMLCGKGGIPEEWIRPFGSRLETSILGCETVCIEDLIDRTLRHAQYTDSTS